MICKHCGIAFSNSKQLAQLPGFENISRQIVYSGCPECHELNIWYYEYDIGFSNSEPYEIQARQIYPTDYCARKPSPEIPKEYFDDINEACMILEFSPKASAALCRRCLQAIIRKEFNINHGNLGREIEQVIKDKLLPEPVLDCLDALRKLGNYASHPEFNTHTGELITVTKEEAEWTLDVIEMIASMYFAFKNKSNKIIESISRKKLPPP